MGEQRWTVRNLELIQIPGPTCYEFRPTTASKTTTAQHHDSSESPAPQEANTLLTESSQRTSKLPIPLDIHVNTDYNYIELALNAMYSPQNQYCYHIDVKSDQQFKNRMKRLTECFPNVHLTQEAYSVDSRGFNTTRAYLACFRHLLAANGAWKYALTLQVHDFPLHTNLELVRILDKLQGSNDVKLREWKHRMPKGMSWDFADLNILPNSNLFRGKEALNISKGSVATSLSRAFVEFAVTSIDTTVLLKHLDSFTIADEIFFATINHNLALNPPGGYPGKCLLKGTQLLKPWISRFAIWEGYKMCITGYDELSS
uniref:Uncharacterized protein n=1 Tax=Plectus sambesii TaxID=2011161 RepID=A0A914WBK8_9BILA